MRDGSCPAQGRGRGIQSSPKVGAAQFEICPDWRLVPCYPRAMLTQSTITCPTCGHRATETMPTNACQFFYDCRGCGDRLKPRNGDCCVFCSYGTVPCPPKQAGACCQ
jgi:hypothetical protein